MKTGDHFTCEFSFTQEDVEKFSELTGDNNPIHLNEEFASKTVFKKPIMHGFLSGSIFSKVLGTLFPGEGTIYLSQTMEFKRPMFVNEIYEAEFTVKETFISKSRAAISTIIKDKNTGKEMIVGEAMVINKNIE